MTVDFTPIADETYDSYAVFDSVPAIVSSLDKTESRFWSLLLAFVGVGSIYVGATKDLPLP